MVRRLIIGLLGALLLIGVTAGPTNATVGDTRPCVTKREFRFVRTYLRYDNNFTRAQVRRVFDTKGLVLLDYYDDYDFGYYEDVWVEDGYWDDWSGEWVDTSYWDYQWHPDVVWSGHDQVRSYRKCSPWGPGGSYVGVWFDTYTDDQVGLRTIAVTPRAPGTLVRRFWTWWGTVPWPGTMEKGAGDEGREDGDGPRRVLPKQ